MEVFGKITLPTCSLLPANWQDLCLQPFYVPTGSSSTTLSLITPRFFPCYLLCFHRTTNNTPVRLQWRQQSLETPGHPYSFCCYLLKSFIKLICDTLLTSFLNSRHIHHTASHTFPLGYLKRHLRCLNLES